MSTSFWQRLVRGGRRLRQRADWQDFAGPDWADRIMEVTVSDRFHAKQGRSTGRWVLDQGGRRLAVYLKRHYRLPWRHGVLALVRPGGGWSPAFQEWSHLEWARREGFAVPLAVAACEYIGPWGALQSMLAVEELAGMLPLHEAIPLAARRLDPRTFGSWKRGLVAEVARLTSELHRRRRFHKDFYLCHFYIPAELTERLPLWSQRVHLIDLHRLGHHPWTWRFWRVKDLAQLLYSSEIVGIGARDRLRFWRQYLGPGARGCAASWLAWCIRLQGQNYRRHNAKRRRQQASAPTHERTERPAA
jgi:heptose I phosphotransferase